MCYSNTAEYSSSSRCVDDANRVAVILGFAMFYDYPPPRGASRPFAGRPPLAESFIGARSFPGQIVGLLRGKGVEPPRGGGTPSGARESQLFSGYIITKMFSKIHSDIITFTTEEHYTIWIYIHTR